jgi:hypothetical protein
MPSGTPSSAKPPHVAVKTALAGSESLTSLMQRLRQSQAMLEALNPQLPEGLRASVKPGPLDDSGWSLLVAHAAAAAKLRQMLPELRAALAAQGFPVTEIRLRVQARHR